MGDVEELAAKIKEQEDSYHASEKRALRQAKLAADANLKLAAKTAANLKVERKRDAKRARAQLAATRRSNKMLEPYKREREGLPADLAADKRYHDNFKSTSVMCVFCQKDFSDTQIYKNPKDAL